ncbi:MAG: class C sortase [Ruthenibacterium sp.]
MKKKLPLLAIGLIFVLGVAVLLYPVVSALLSKVTATATVNAYQAAVSAIDTDARDAMLSAARSYNAKFADGVRPPPFDGADSAAAKEYQALLNVDGIMGYLEVPAIKIYLPISHGVGEDALQKGVGHLPESSLPVGGGGTHAVLSAHCGLPSARLFTDLDQLQVGDDFFVHVLGQTLAYRVDHIQVVLPEDVRALRVVPGKDYVTLLTCTPYGINSHRLLVRGIGVPLCGQAPAVQPDPPAPPEIAAAAPRAGRAWLWLTGIPALLVLAVLLRRKRRRQKKE